MTDFAQELPQRVQVGCYMSSSSAQTEALGELFGSVLAPGDVVVLTGDLGAGKTHFTKGVARGLGSADDVTSPTFTIEMVYNGSDMPLYHFDLYRLDSADQLEDTGLFDALEADGACLIEWGEQFSDEIGPERLDITITRASADAEDPTQEPARTIALTGTSERARELIALLDSKVGN